MKRTSITLLALGLLALGSSAEAATLPVTDGLRLWLETENGEGIAYNTSGTEVTAWLDQSGNDFDVTSSGGKGPRLETGVAALGGHTALDFVCTAKNTGDYLSGSHQVFNTGYATVFTVMEMSGLNWHDARMPLDTGGGSLPVDRWFMWANGSKTTAALTTFGFGRDDNQGGAPTIAPPPVAGTHMLVSAVANGANPNSGIWINGGADGSDLGSISATASQGPTLVLGAHSSGTVAYWNGRMAEWIVYNRVLTNDGSADPNGNEFNSVGWYLQDKYGLEGDFVKPIGEPTGVIPEPSTLAIWALGLLGLALYARRRSRKG